MKPLVTIICPVFNEEKTVPLFYDRVVKICQKLEQEYRCHLLFVDNCSTDRTFEIIQNLRKSDDRVFHLGLSINVGYQKSMECALRNAEGDFFFIIDVDCEDPPEMLEEFLRVQKEGYDIVYGERVDREEGLLLKAVRKLFYRLTRFISDEHFFVDMAEFCLMTSEVRDAVAQDQSSFPFIRASIGRVGFSYKGIPYKRHHRIAGESHYNIYRLVVFAVAGILSSSTLPLRLMAYLFPAVILFCAASLWTAGKPTENILLIGILFYLAVGVMFNSIYIARIYKNGLGRPNAVLVRRKTERQPSA
jgi:dolichol-phosphate mannosyltransferase